jgi:hypothetical protein
MQLQDMFYKRNRIVLGRLRQHLDKYTLKKGEVVALRREDIWWNGCIDPHFLDLGTTNCKKLYTSTCMGDYNARFGQ